MEVQHSAAVLRNHLCGDQTEISREENHVDRFLPEGVEHMLRSFGGLMAGRDHLPLDAERVCPFQNGRLLLIRQKKNDLPRRRVSPLRYPMRVG